MIMNIYSVYDVKAEIFHPPMYQPNDALAMRMIYAALHDQSNLALFPDEFILFRIGEFDDLSAIITPSEVRENIGSVREIAKRFAGLKPLDIGDHVRTEPVEEGGDRKEHVG